MKTKHNLKTEHTLLGTNEYVLVINIAGYRYKIIKEIDETKSKYSNLRTLAVEKLMVANTARQLLHHQIEMKEINKTLKRYKY